MANLIMLMCTLQRALRLLMKAASTEAAGGGKTRESSQFSLLSGVMKTAALIPVGEGIQRKQQRSLGRGSTEIMECQVRA